MPLGSIYSASSTPSAHYLIVVNAGMSSSSQQVERVEKSSLSGDSLVDMVHVVLQNAVIAAESEELGQVVACP